MERVEISYWKGSVDDEKALSLIEDAFAQECKKHFRAMVLSGDCHLLEVFTNHVFAKNVVGDDGEVGDLVTITFAVDRLVNYELRSVVHGTNIVATTKVGTFETDL